MGAVLAGPCEENPVRGFQINFGSTQTLLDAAAALKTRKFFMVSSISVFGRDATDVRKNERLGYLPEESYLYRFLNAEETLDFYGKLFDMPAATRKKRSAELITMVGLDVTRKVLCLPSVIERMRGSAGPRRRSGGGADISMESVRTTPAPAESR